MNSSAINGYRAGIAECLPVYLTAAGASSAGAAAVRPKPGGTLESSIPKIGLQHSSHRWF